MTAMIFFGASCRIAEYNNGGLHSSDITANSNAGEDERMMNFS
jgi:hypothetical protein